MKEIIFIDETIYSRVPHITKYNYDRLQDTNGYLIKYHFYQSPSYKYVERGEGRGERGEGRGDSVLILIIIL